MPSDWPVNVRAWARLCEKQCKAQAQSQIDYRQHATSLLYCRYQRLYTQQRNQLP